MAIIFPAAREKKKPGIAGLYLTCESICRIPSGVPTGIRTPVATVKG